MLSSHAKWLYPLILMAVLTPFTPWLDLKFSSYFFDNKHFVTGALTDSLFDYGVLPAQIVTLLAILLYLLSYVRGYWKFLRKACLVIILTMAVGEGFIVHAVLKDHWGRPRPKQVEQFGGQQEFRPYYKPNFFNQPEPSKSFVCGHCGMGFFFLVFTVLGLRYQNKWMIGCGLAAGIGLGSVMGIARIAQGGHFLTDVLWSAYVIWLTAVVSDYLVYNQEDNNERLNKAAK